MEQNFFDALRITGANPADIYRGEDPAAEAAQPLPQAEQLAKQSAGSLALSVIEHADEPTAAQQYLTLEQQIVPQAAPQSEDEITSGLARQLLLAQTGVLFNGSVSGGAEAEPNAKAAFAALRDRQNATPRPDHRIAGIDELGQLGSDMGDDAEDEDEAFFAGMVSGFSIPQEELGIFETTPEGYSSFTDRSGGIIL